MILKLNDKGETIESFPSLKKAGKSVGGYHFSISRAIKGNRKYAGFYWKNSTEEDGKKTPTKIGETSHANDNLSYKFSDNLYKWYLQSELVTVESELADRLFFEFSKHGQNLSSNEVRIRNGISLKHWHSLKNRLQLYKDSDIFAPETRKGLTDKEYRELAATKISELNAYKKKAVIDEYNKFHLNNAERWRNEANRKSFVHEKILDELSEWLEARPKYVEIAVNKSSSTEHIIAATADWHNGAETESQYNTPKYSPDTVKSLVNAFSDRVNSYNAKEVTLAFLGDYIETWTGLNHPNSWQGIAAGYYGAKVVKETIENLFEPIIKNVANIKRIIAVGGNHDRGTNSNKEDVKSEIASLMFYMLQRLYPSIEILYNPFCVNPDLGNIRFILQHGNFNSTSKSEALVNDYGTHAKFNLILSADKHTRAILTDGWNRRHVKVPPMFTGNFYSTSMGFSSVSGCLIIKENNGLPDIEDISFYSKLNEKAV